MKGANISRLVWAENLFKSFLLKTDNLSPHKEELYCFLQMYITFFFFHNLLYF